MKNERRKYTPAEELCLTTQVDGRCPLCGSNLFYQKKSSSYKNYQLAHIYPLNPTPSEIEELKDEELLHADINHPDNILPLCLLCHGKFDKPRTKEEYRKLASLKKIFLTRSKQQELHKSYQIESDVLKIIEGLYSDDPKLHGLDLEYDPKRLRDKFDNTLTLPTQMKIKHNVADYYRYIKAKFLEIEQENPNSSVLIYSQVRTFYLKQKGLAISQQEIFSNIVDWLNEKTNPETIEAAEIVTSFFIQNCEVFE